jgi:hypothetical protein
MFFNMMKSPIAFGTRSPSATVCGFSQGAAFSAPSWKARTIGAQPCVCTVTIFGR